MKISIVMCSGLIYQYNENASELLENFEEMFPQFCMESDVISLNVISHAWVLPVEKGFRHVPLKNGHGAKKNPKVTSISTHEDSSIWKHSTLHDMCGPKIDLFRRVIFLVKLVYSAFIRFSKYSVVWKISTEREPFVIETDDIVLYGGSQQSRNCTCGRRKPSKLWEPYHTANYHDSDDIVFR